MTYYITKYYLMPFWQKTLLTLFFYIITINVLNTNVIDCAGHLPGPIKKIEDFRTGEDFSIIVPFLEHPEKLPYYTNSGLKKWDQILELAETRQAADLSRVGVNFLGNQTTGRLLGEYMTDLSPFRSLLTIRRQEIADLLAQRGL